MGFQGLQDSEFNGLGPLRLEAQGDLTRENPGECPLPRFCRKNRVLLRCTLSILLGDAFWWGPFKKSPSPAPAFLSSRLLLRVLPKRSKGEVNTIGNKTVTLHEISWDNLLWITATVLAPLNEGTAAALGANPRELTNHPSSLQCSPNSGEISE